MPTMISVPEQHPAVLEVQARRRTAFSKLRTAEARLSESAKGRDQLGVLESQRAIQEAEEAIEGADRDLSTAWAQAVADARAAHRPEVHALIRRLAEHELEGYKLAEALRGLFTRTQQNGVSGGMLFAGLARIVGDRANRLTVAGLEPWLRHLATEGVEVEDLVKRLQRGR